MSQAPTSYTRQNNFVSDAQNNPNITVPQIATDLDAEYNAIVSSVNQTIDRLAELQRDDGGLRKIVTLYTLSNDALAYLNIPVSTIKGAWATATAYAVRDVVSQSGGVYMCAVAHTSSAILITDIEAGKWFTLQSPPSNNNIIVNRFTGNGSQTVFTLTGTGTTVNSNVFISGVYQQKDSYTISGNVLTLNTAASNGAIVEVLLGAVATVTIADIPNLSVTAAKLAASAVDTSKIASQAVTSEKLSDLSVVTAKINDAAVTTGKLADGAVTAAKIDANAKIGGATGAGTDRVFYENDQTVNTSYTITTNKNAMTAGPITIANGASVSVPSGSTWTIV